MWHAFESMILSVTECVLPLVNGGGRCQRVVGIERILKFSACLAFASSNRELQDRCNDHIIESGADLGVA
jgi:hypothetical protein